MRTILHSDLNNCFASIESINHPEYKDIPFAVGGDEEQRHGIILAKNYCAKAYGIKTGEPLLSARQKCPELKVVKPNFELYDRYCIEVRKLYSEYTDQVEPFGMDECWLDTTDSASLFGDGEKIANEIREKVKKEFGLTVSLGVSYNKIFAKIGSDYKKPDAVTVISPGNYRDIVWPLPVEDLLYVGRSTQAHLNKYGIKTIGELAATPREFLHSVFGKNGDALYYNANGLDTSTVSRVTDADVIKSIGNSTTTPRDMKNEADVNIIFNLLSEQVCRRLRKHNKKCSVVQIALRNSELMWFERQIRLDEPTDVSGVMCDAAMKLLRENYTFSVPLRSIGVRACSLTNADTPVQMSFFSDIGKQQKLESIEQVKDKINGRYGQYAICRAVILSDETLKPNYDPLQSKTSTFRSH